MRATPEQMAEETLTRMEQTMRERGLTDADTPALLMVSGGSDSTALAYLGAELSQRGAIGQAAILHVNHGIRGADADEDQAFVEKLGALLGLPVFTCFVNVPELVEETGENLEAVARRERYQAAHQALESLCRHAGAPISTGRILTAHTQDDRVENFYMRSIVGTGPGGFRSMRYLNGQVARPCLDLSRQKLRIYLAARKKAGMSVLADAASGKLWREDATNAHTDLFRAYVRHEIVPRAKERNERLLDTLTRSMNLIADEDDYMDGLAQVLVDTQVTWLPEAGALFAPEFGSAPLPVQRRAAHKVLASLLGSAARVETAAVETLLAAWADGRPVSGYTANIQGNLAVSANKRGVRLEPMEAYRARRKRR